MSDTHPPRPDELEVSLFGPGYGECAIVHIGGGEWIVVDSFLTSTRVPVALQYFDDLGLNPAQAVRLIVATHWHDDHIKGLGKLVSRCSVASFCCASALSSREFLSVAAALREADLPANGIREIHTVMSHLDSTDAHPVWASARRMIYRSSSCKVWALSPDDEANTSFLRSLALSPGIRPARGIASPTANQLSVALLICFDGGISCLFGADLERRGWAAVLHDDSKPPFRSSVFKVPHHGSANAHVEGVWDELLEPEPIAILAPWRRGGGALPKEDDVTRILTRAPDAYATTNAAPGALTRDRWVRKKLRDINAQFWPEFGTTGMIRLRRATTGESAWRVDLFGSACHLKDFAV